MGDAELNADVEVNCTVLDDAEFEEVEDGLESSTNSDYLKLRDIAEAELEVKLHKYVQANSDLSEAELMAAIQGATIRVEKRDIGYVAIIEGLDIRQRDAVLCGRSIAGIKSGERPSNFVSEGRGYGKFNLCVPISVFDEEGSSVLDVYRNLELYRAKIKECLEGLFFELLGSRTDMRGQPWNLGGVNLDGSWGSQLVSIGKLHKLATNVDGVNIWELLSARGAEKGLHVVHRDPGLYFDLKISVERFDRLWTTNGGLQAMVAERRAYVSRIASLKQEIKRRVNAQLLGYIGVDMEDVNGDVVEDIVFEGDDAAGEIAGGAVVVIGEFVKLRTGKTLNLHKRIGTSTLYLDASGKLSRQ